MKWLFFVVPILSLVGSSCGLSPTPTTAPKESPPATLAPLTPTPAPRGKTMLVTSTKESPPATLALPTPIPVPRGKTMIVTNIDDSGPGTLRQALVDAQAGDTVTFDPAVFPPDDPSIIFLNSNLPELDRGSITLDASNVGVILDGTNIREGSATGLIISSSGNIIQGSQIVNFSEIGIGLAESASGNTIGGDHNTGNGPLGQGNLHPK